MQDLSMPIELSKQVESTIKSVQIKDFSFSKDEGDLILGQNKCSERAVRNFSKWFKIPKGLLISLTEENLNRVVKEQVARYNLDRFNFLYNPVDSSEIIACQPASAPYIPYSSIIEKLGRTVFKIKGNPVIHDDLRILTNEGTINVDGDELIIGNQLNISSMGIRQSYVQNMAYRIICENGLISTESSYKYKISTKDCSTDFICSVINLRAKEIGNFGRRMETFVEKTMNRVVESEPSVILDDMEESTLVSKSVVKK